MNENKKSEYRNWITMVNILNSIITKQEKTTLREQAALKRAVNALWFIETTHQERIFDHYEHDPQKPFTEEQIKFLSTTAGRMEMFELEVGKIQPLTLEEEQDLLTRSQQEDRAAEDMLFEAYKPFILETIEKKIKKFYLVMAGKAAILFAMKKYKPESNLPLKDFVRNEIEQAIEKTWKEHVAKTQNGEE